MNHYFLLYCFVLMNLIRMAAKKILAALLQTIYIVTFVNHIIAMFLDNIKFFKTPKRKPFEYKPLYYDEQKEELQKRVDAARQEMQNEKDYSQTALKERIDFRSSRQNSAARPSVMTNVRVLLIATILVAVLYFVYKYL